MKKLRVKTNRRLRKLVITVVQITSPAKKETYIEKWSNIKGKKVKSTLVLKCKITLNYWET